MNRFSLIFIMFVALSGCNGGSSEGESSEPSILKNFNISKIAESSTSDEVVIEMPGGVFRRWWSVSQSPSNGGCN